ncbi:MAG: SagB/ThcOx family dehydrogenase, partial [Phycisphaerae bacterium]|nr:SagB/ThcOx family dehydrogenase [Phycisphaerae bacterium]
MLLALLLITGIVVCAAEDDARQAKSQPLPPPNLEGKMPLEQAIAKRRSVREFANTAVTLPELGQLCWAGQGITDPDHGYRASPSAGATFPIELLVVSHEGVDHYQPKDHSLARVLTGDYRRILGEAGLGQKAFTSAPVSIIITAVIERTAGKYRDRAERYCVLEAGHVAQNILLQATSLDLAGVPMGGFDDVKVGKALNLPAG